MAHRVVLFLTFQKVSVLFALIAVPIYSSINSAQRFHSLPHPHQYLSFCLFDNSHSNGFNYHSLMTGDVEQFFMYLLVICMYSLGKKKSLLKFSYFLIKFLWVFFLLLSCMSYFFFFYFIFFLFVVNFVIHWNKTAMGLHVFPIPIPPPTSRVISIFWILTAYQIYFYQKSLQENLGFHYQVLQILPPSTCYLIPSHFHIFSYLWHQHFSQYQKLC